MNSILSTATSRALPAKANAKAPSKPKVAKGKVAAKEKAPKTKAVKASEAGKKMITIAALNAVADKLAETFIGAHNIVDATITKKGARLLLEDGNTVLIEIRKVKK